MTSQNLTAEGADKHARNNSSEDAGAGGRSSWHILSPFSSSALASLPTGTQRPQRYTREDGIPEVDDNGHAPSTAVRDYHSINPAVQIRVPKKIPTSIKVEGKVWFANERTWISWLNLAVLLGTLSLALFNASDEPVARNFAYVYALISIGVLIYGYLLYQRRITMIRKRDPGHYDQILGPVIVSALLFFAVLANFIVRGA
ncbi:hypothetical protein CONPUDRAFT_50017 [Coniophora puteana RWD-64-598 SS2]|uniref:DUF202 domain-containing protein n=1 Tax=Coniophora puteana (strain RWD-64-598) TaxID=741705 RepID=A0A5M3MYT6_CONPW|nr:uncharacterized protein CONPUDRAFT_50017 [Coniophora puteana RWD-64-598 SS2]EIW84302.1 hypothetical protein CONPUDRAFT_50017 [Coniophora puteana RWD-64-598 SS2]